VGGMGAPTPYLKDIDGGPPWEAMLEVLEYLRPILKMSMAGLPTRRCRELGAPTTYVEYVDGGPPGR
jgi:hypothetical protein